VVFVSVLWVAAQVWGWEFVTAPAMLERLGYAAVLLVGLTLLTMAGVMRWVQLKHS
jgi:hypothetical protein